MMLTDEEVKIQQVANGYIVFPSRGPNTLYSDSEIFVFQSFRELNNWLAGHFTYINKTLLSDV